MTLSKRELKQLQHAAVNEIAAYLNVDFYLSKRQTAYYLSISLSSVETAMAKRGLPYFKIGKKVLFKKSEIDSWMGGNRENIDSQDIRQLADEAVRKVLGE